MGATNRTGETKSMPHRMQESVQHFCRKGPQIPDPTGFLRHVIFLLVLIGGALVLFAAFGEGDDFIERLGDSYGLLIDQTTDGTPWTHIMRDNRLYFIIPAAIVMIGLGWWLKLNYAGRAVFMYSAFGIGFVGGHVFW